MDFDSCFVDVDGVLFMLDRQRWVKQKLFSLVNYKPIWFYACEVNHGSDFLDMAVDGEV